jgi:endonuclease/exonuclease/phosphatase family metal-dependent hydrolase
MKTPKLIAFVIFLYIGLFCFTYCSPKEPMTLKVMSYNIRHGEGLDTLLDLSRAAAVIKSVAPDLCGIQEVDKHCSRSDTVDQTEYLAKSTSMTGTFGKFMEYQGGEYGMATLMAKPIVSTTVLQLPEGKYEPRTSLVHEVQITDGCIIAFANVHFDWIDDEDGRKNRLAQARTLVRHVDSLALPAIITGDFNCTPDSPTMRYFTSQGFVFVDKGEDNLSFQGNRKVEIDHLIFRDAGNVRFSKKSVDLLEEPVVSDHRPLVVELTVTH